MSRLYENMIFYQPQPKFQVQVPCYQVQTQRCYPTQYNKENINPSEQVNQYNQMRCKSATKQMPLTEITNNYSMNMAQATNNIFKDTTPINKVMFQIPSNERCFHNKQRKYRLNYCFDCGLYLPSNGANAYRETIFKQKLDNNPDQVHKIMLEKQHNNRYYVPEALYLKYRKVLVDWVCEIGEDLKFSGDAIHLSISYLDTILLKLDVPKNKLQLVCLCCLVIASKFGEREEKVPRLKDLFDFCKGTYSVELFKKTEVLILELLEWKLKTITPFQFIHFYLSKGVVYSSDQTLIRGVDAKLLRFLRKYTEFFVDLSLQEYTFNIYSSNILACAAIAGARKAVGLYPFWSVELEDLTGVYWRDISDCFEQLYKYFEKTFPEIAIKANNAALNSGLMGNTITPMKIEDVQPITETPPIKTNHFQSTGDSTLNNYSSVKVDIPIFSELNPINYTLTQEIAIKDFTEESSNSSGAEDNAMKIEEYNSQDFFMQINRNLLF
jgi:hypothetical protein